MSRTAERGRSVVQPKLSELLDQCSNHLTLSSCLRLWRRPLVLLIAKPSRFGFAYSSISGAMVSLWVAQDYGYFRRHGLDVQLLYIGGGAVATQALIGGDVQFVRLGANAVVQASLRGVSLKMIANTINTLVFSLMARPEIHSAERFEREENRSDATRRVD